MKRLHVTAQGLSLENRAPQVDGVLGALLAKLGVFAGAVT